MSKRVQPELASLRQVDWQFFCTLTFRQARLPERVRASLWFALLRTQAANFRLHFKRVLWALRREHGEQTGRYHFHALIGGLPFSAKTTATCFSIMKTWERIGGGHARVTVFNPQLEGVDYILKEGTELAQSLVSRRAGDEYELTKFGGSCDLTLSQSVLKHIGFRSQNVKWLAGGCGRTDGPSSTTQRPAEGFHFSVNAPAITARTLSYGK